MKRLLLVALLIITFQATAQDSLGAKETDLVIQEALKKSIEKHARSEAPFNLEGHWQLLVPQDLGILNFKVAPKNYLDYFLVYRIVIGPKEIALFQVPGRKPVICKWRHAQAATFFEFYPDERLYPNDIQLIYRFNYFVGLGYETKEVSDDIWLSILDAIEIGLIENKGIELSLRYMEKEISAEELKKGFDEYSQNRRTPNIITFPVVMTVFINGKIEFDSTLAIFTRHDVLPGQ
jgi:hypothetical protein